MLQEEKRCIDEFGISRYLCDFATHRLEVAGKELMALAGTCLDRTRRADMVSREKGEPKSESHGLMGVDEVGEEDGDKSSKVKNRVALQH